MKGKGGSAGNKGIIMLRKGETRDVLDEISL